MADVKVSVIIPIYNTEQFLEQCLNSVIYQTLQEIEIICVDDGSEDGTPEILRQYEAKDSRIRVITQSNSGLGTARNSGIQIAAGEYLAFLDSDDWFEPETLEKLYAKAVRDEADLCVCGRINHLENQDRQICYKILPNNKAYPSIQPFSIRDNPDGVIDFSDIVVWNKLYRRSFLAENRISFPQVKRGEDLCFTTVAVCTAKRITILNEALIHYRVMRPESLTATLYENPEEYVDNWLATADELRKRKVYPERCIANLAWASFLWVIQRVKWPEYVSLYNRIKTEALPALGIRVHEPGYYIHSWQEELLKYMYAETAEEFLLHYLLATEMRIRKARALKQTQEDNQKARNEGLQEEIKNLKAELKKQKARTKAQAVRLESAEEEIRSVKASKSYRIGRMITQIPRKIKLLFKAAE